jgi:hypothetical protein
MCREFRLSCAVVVSTLLASAAIAQNLAPNAELDENDDGWFADSGSIGWIAEDSNGCNLEALSGGLGVTSSTESLPRAQINGGCFTVTPLQNICFAMDYIHGADLTMIGVSFFPDAACEINTGGGAFIGGPGATEDFVTIHTCSTVPADIHSARMRVDTLAFDGVQYTVVVDRFYAGLEDRAYVEDFETGSTCRWSNTAP